MNIIIKNGRVIDPKNNIDSILDVHIKNGKIFNLGLNLFDRNAKVINVNKSWVVPGLIDLHVHLRDPGQTYKEDIETGCLSALKGGVTTVCCMPNTTPFIDSEFVVEYIKMKAEKVTKANVLPIACITKGQKGLDIVDIEKLKQVGICGISEDGKTVVNPKIMKDAMKIATNYNLPTFSHCEDMDLKAGGQINESEQSKKLDLKGINNESEYVIVARDINLAKEDKSKLHICHVSTKSSVELIRDGKKYNNNLTAEVAPHHFTLIDLDVVDGNYKMSPPLRNAEDVKEILKGLADNTIDVIATDHAPHAHFEKNREIEKCANGIVGLETLVPLTLKLVHNGILTAKQFVEKTSLNPAKIINIDRGTLGIGKIADITIIDYKKEYKIQTKNFVSKSKNSPFNNFKVKGCVLYTIVNGEIVYSNEDY